MYDFSIAIVDNIFIIEDSESFLTNDKLKKIIGEDLYYEMLEMDSIHLKLLIINKKCGLYIASRDEREAKHMINLIKSLITLKKLS